MKLRYLLSIFSLLIQTILSAQDYQEQFNAALEKRDTLAMLPILQKWEAQTPNDAELFTSYFNYYYLISAEETISVLPDDTDSTQVIMEPGIYYKKLLVDKAFAKIDEGISRYPNRLDMRFGKCYVLGEIKDWERFTNEIITTINYSAVNKNQWTWANNEPVEDGQYFLLTSIQDYQVQLYYTGDDALLKNMRRIGNAILELYPDHVESMSNISISYVSEKEYDKAIAILQKALKLNPEDYIVITNIAQAYKLKGDKPNAIKYYKQLITYGDEESVAYAKAELQKLEK